MSKNGPVTPGTAPVIELGTIVRRTLHYSPLLLFALSAGLVAYALWRFICAGMDLERRGHDGEGVIAAVWLNFS